MLVKEISVLIFKLPLFVVYIMKDIDLFSQFMDRW